LKRLPIADAFYRFAGLRDAIYLSHPLAERLCAEIAELGLTAMIPVLPMVNPLLNCPADESQDGRQGVFSIFHTRT